MRRVYFVVHVEMEWGGGEEEYVSGSFETYVAQPFSFFASGEKIRDGGVEK